MCGSFQQPGGIRIIREFASLTGIPLTPFPQFSVSDLSGLDELTLRPFSDALMIFAGKDGGLKLAPVYWQLIHDWEKEFKSRYSCFNVRAESLDRPHNHNLLLRRRWVFPVGGFFENRQANGKTIKPRQVYEFSLPGRSLMTLGGIYSVWTNPANGKDRRLSGSIITVSPNKTVGEIHSRMPFIVPPDQISAWLNRDFDDLEKLKEMIRPYEGPLEAFPRR